MIGNANPAERIHRAPSECSIGKKVVKLVYREQEFEVRGGSTLGKALIKCQLNPHVVLAVRKGKLITEDVILHDGDEIKLVAVISGG